MMLIKKGLLRGGIPFIIMEAFASALYLQGKLAESNDLFFGGLVLLILGATTVIYNIDQWSLTKQSAVHFSIMLGTLFPVLLLSGWYPVTSLQDILLVFMIFISSGLIIWMIMFILAKVFKHQGSI
ncbi:DUF3021 family protein [Salinicoccus jeotgali]|uniref:DUF3021 domain-containing protein n=1 Tax=Salinicoccus jeotgali TaxID=381634 RepID=A0ABP7ED62_9STAP